jgi:DNA-binding LacI/PurR family transcriptional regulator
MDALICANDAMAFGALSALADHDISVPDDMSVIGFDDIAMAKWPAFRLTTIRNPMDLLVDTVIDLLDRRLANATRPAETIFLATELILRETH